MATISAETSAITSRHIARGTCSSSLTVAVPSRKDELQYQQSSSCSVLTAQQQPHFHSYVAPDLRRLMVPPDLTFQIMVKPGVAADSICTPWSQTSTSYVELRGDADRDLMPAGVVGPRMGRDHEVDDADHLFQLLSPRHAPFCARPQNG
jgi:hypothetical protein